MTKFRIGKSIDSQLGEQRFYEFGEYQDLAGVIEILHKTHEPMKLEDNGAEIYICPKFVAGKKGDGYIVYYRTEFNRERK